MPRILAVAESRDGGLRKASYEVVTAARAVADGLGADVDVVVLGAEGLSGQAAELGRVGADRVRVAEGAAHEVYDPEAATAAVVELVQGGDYGVVLFAASSLGKDLAPRVAARLDVPLATDATALDVEDGSLVVTRPIFAGKAFARVALDAEPQLVSLRPNIFTPREQPRSAEVEPLEVSAGESRVRIREVVPAAGERPDVADAAVIVSGGRGLRGPEGWHILEELCEALGSSAALGASRAVVDAGWRPHAEQVGQTGKTVAPQLYIAVGISGAIQHLAGMRTARTIVAINKDPDAPIFKIADYGIVGDAFEVVPALAEAIRQNRQ
jgi:electron transfer flavoprotein alpha subunit